jgi:Transglutaminase-like superfamily
MKISLSCGLEWANFRRGFWLGIFSSLFLATARPAVAQCDLQIVSAGPCLSDGSAYATPAVGNDYYLKVVVNVVGTPANPFRIRWTMANVTNYFDNISLTPGAGYWWFIDYDLSLDDVIPWSVTLDPDGVSGDTNLANNTMSGTFTPTPPATASELYNPQLVGGSETTVVDCQPDAGYSNAFWIVFGEPSTHGAQSVISVSGLTNAVRVVTPPNNVPVLQLGRTNPPMVTFQDTEKFTAELSSIRVNPGLLREVTWAEQAGLTTNWTEWLAPDPICESADSSISNFVLNALPANYRTTMTPYDTARTLHKAVMAALTYQYPPDYADAVNVLAAGEGDCGGYSALLVAALRQVGIPARRILGFWTGDTWSGDSQWHVRVEFHLPGTEWLVADPCIGSTDFDTTGTYAYEFGFLPDADEFFAMDVGDAHELPYGSYTGLQLPEVGWLQFSGYLNYLDTESYLQPVNTLTVSNIASGQFRFTLTNAPFDGSIVVESSTDLLNWSPAATNAASADTNSFSFSMPMAGTGHQFFRANQIP